MGTRTPGAARRAVALMVLGWGGVCAPRAAAVDNLGLFELDGNPNDAVAGLPDDFASVRLGTPSDGVINHVFRHDAIVDVDGSDVILTGGASKDSSDLPGWRWTPINSLQPKNDIANAYAASYIYLGPNTGIHQTGDIVYYVGADIAPGTGASNLSFWLLQDPSFAQQPGGTFTGVHQNYDVLIQANVAAGGTVDTTMFYWLSGSLVTILASTGCTGANPLGCGIANTVALSVPAGWPTPATTWVEGKYYEAGINVTALLRSLGQPQGCYGPAAALTRASPQVSATLTDYVDAKLQTCLTRASLGAVSVERAGRVAFSVTSQRDTAAFRLWAADDARGLRRRALLETPLAAQTGARGPFDYQALTAPIRERFVFVEEQTTAGARRLLGPFEVDAPAVRERAQAAPVERAPEARARRSPESAAPSALKIETLGRGSACVRVADLVAAGMPSGALASATLTRLGEGVRFQLSQDGGGAPCVRFTTRGLTSQYAAREVHVLSWGAVAPRAPTLGLSVSGFAPAEPLLRVAPDRLYVPFAAREADPWVWDLVVSDSGPAAFDFDLPGLLPPVGAVEVRVGVIGAGGGRHSVSARLNGALVGHVTFHGLAMAEIRGSVPAAALSAAGNQLVLEDSASQPYGLLLLDVLDLGVQLAPAEAAVTGLAPFDATQGLLPETEYLIVTHADYLSAAQRLAAAKSAEGFAAQVLDVERAYDRHAAGVPEALAVRALLREALGRGHRLRYVLLLGDDTFDPRGLLGGADRADVPSLDGWDGAFGRVPSENLYADLDGDGAPEVALGRLPARSAAEAELLVDKIEAQQALLSPGRARHVFALDNQSPGDFPFPHAGRQVAEQLPPGSSVTYADVSTGVTAARAALLAALGEGRALAHYFGHAGNAQWADEHLLDTGMLAGLAGTQRASVVLSWACESDWYQYDLGSSLGEALLRVPQGGAVASFGPSGISEPVLQRMLYQRLYAHLLDGARLGDAVRAAKAEAAQATPQARPVIEGFNLLGDPALAVPLAP